MGNIITMMYVDDDPVIKGLFLATGPLMVAGGLLLPVNLDNSTVATFMNMTEYGCFSIWFGVQTWMSFVAGVTMIKILPRPMFSKAQKALFGTYYKAGYKIGSILLSLHLLRYRNFSWQNDILYQGCAMMGTILLSASCIYLKPQLDAIVSEMRAVEAKYDQSDVVGVITSERLLKDPDYQVLRKQFGQGHLLAMGFNFAMYGLSGYLMYTMAKKISI